MGKKIHRGEEALEDYRDDHRYDYMGGSDKYRLHYRNLTRHSPEIKALRDEYDDDYKHRRRDSNNRYYED